MAGLREMRRVGRDKIRSSSIFISEQPQLQRQASN
ncbi:unnamed protein product, partial [Amoebophrya sp. A25]|eukprot:GSA25T00001335001.1